MNAILLKHKRISRNIRNFEINFRYKHMHETYIALRRYARSVIICYNRAIACVNRWFHCKPRFYGSYNLSKNSSHLRLIGFNWLCVDLIQLNGDILWCMAIARINVLIVSRRRCSLIIKRIIVILGSLCYLIR